MKVARLYRYRDIRIEDEPVPEISDNEVLVKTGACGICTGDVMPWYIEKKAPLVLGHEPAGTIVKKGKNVKGVKEGDRVFIHHHAPCMGCLYCKRGDYVQCETWRRSRIIPGGLSEYIRVPEVNLRTDTLLLPDDMEFEVATLVEPTACVVKSLRRASVKEGDTILVIGLGIMGILHVLLAKNLGVKTVIGADMVHFRLKKALELGADHVIDVREAPLKEAVMQMTSSKGAEVVIVGPGSVEAIESALEVVSRGGTVVIFTPTPEGETLSLDPNSLYFRDITLTTSYSCGPEDTREALQILSSGAFDPKVLITHRFSLKDVSKAYDLVASRGECLKVVVVF